MTLTHQSRRSFGQSSRISVGSVSIKYVPTKLSNMHPQQPWITARIKRLSNKKQRLYNKARLSHNSDDFHVYKEFKKNVQKECRNAHNNYLANTLNNSSGSKRLWSYIKSKKNDQTGVASMTKFTSTTKIKPIS